VALLIEYKLLSSITYKVLTTTQPTYVHNLFNLLTALALRWAFNTILVTYN